MIPLTKGCLPLHAHPLQAAARVLASAAAREPSVQHALVHESAQPCLRSQMRPLRAHRAIETGARCSRRLCFSCFLAHVCGRLVNRNIKSQTEHGTLTEEGQRIVLRAAFERQSRHMCIKIAAVHEVIYTMVATTRNGTIVAEWMRRARTWRAATLMHTGAGHAPSRRPSGWR